MKRVLTIATLSFFYIGSLSCSPIVGKMIGIQDTKDLTINKIDSSISNSQAFAGKDNYYLDTSYLTYIRSAFRDDSALVKNLSQPMQAMYFEDNRLVSYHINCNAGGFPNLKWNRDNNFGVFIPKTQTDCDSRVELPLIRQQMTAFHTDEKSHKRYTVVIFWNYKFYKQSLGLIRTVEQNIRQYGKEKDVQVYYVNNDLLYKEI
ncbi:MAG TPA: hypothetical protein VN040_14905 [Pseudosphingobacterium sp.]|nr:hypothetical protein [Pseudosphingobacterium sp.]